MSYYAIYIPNINDEENVFLDKNEAFKVLKKYKEARLKVFKTHDDALEFALNGFESISINISNLLKSPSSVVSLEKSAFRAPKSQELVQFRKLIENGDYDNVSKTIWDNPRYLIGSGDTPSILKEGTRYNAIHVTALHNKSKICELILESVRNPHFVQLLHGAKNFKTCQDVSNILLDLYINMPEKGRSDTPLHLAVKYGQYEVIKVLTSYPQCKMSPNLDGLFPKDVICSRMNSKTEAIVQSIKILLEDRFYVPVIRSIDCSMPPIIGEPFTPQNPPNLNNDPLSPEMEIQAYAGPMDKEQAQVFRKRWKTPLRLNLSSPSRTTSNSSISNGSFSFISPVKDKVPSFVLKLDNSSTPITKKNRSLFPNKSLDEESVQNGEIDAPKEFDDSINELECINITNDNTSGLDHSEIIKNESETDEQHENENNFKNSATSLTNLSINEHVFESSFKERHTKLSDTEKGLEIIGRNLAREHKVGWKEYWNFLGTFVDFSTNDGLQQLETYFKNKAYKKRINLETSNKLVEHDLNHLCSALSEFKLTKGKQLSEFQLSKGKQVSDILKSTNNRNEELNNSFTNSPKSVKVYRCVEKSCQIFAQRVTKTFTNNNDINIDLIVDRLDKELKRLRSLFFGYSGDYRFWNVNFKFVHSRFATLIVAYLKKENFDNIVMEKIKNSVEKIEFINKESPDIFCVCRKMKISFLNMDDIEPPENLITEKSCEDAWSIESQCLCDFSKDTIKFNKRHKRNKSSDMYTRKLFNDLDEKTNETTQENKKSDNSDLWKMRDTNSNTISSDYDEEEEEDNDVFFTGSEHSSGDDDEFFTPPESPVHEKIDSNLKLDDNVENKKKFENFILGEQPTKTDVDVLNIIQNIEIDNELFPYVIKWQTAMLSYPKEERECFPSPSIVVKSRINLGSFDATSPNVVRKLFSATPSLPEQNTTKKFLSSLKEIIE